LFGEFVIKTIQGAQLNNSDWINRRIRKSGQVRVLDCFYLGARGKGAAEIQRTGTYHRIHRCWIRI